jgi:hypothetical protein
MCCLTFSSVGEDQRWISNFTDEEMGFLLKGQVSPHITQVTMTKLLLSITSPESSGNLMPSSMHHSHWLSLTSTNDLPSKKALVLMTGKATAFLF